MGRQYADRPLRRAELRTASQKQIDLMARRLVWLSVAVDALLADSRDLGLREQVHAAYHRKLKRMASGESEGPGAMTKRERQSNFYCPIARPGGR